MTRIFVAIVCDPNTYEVSDKYKNTDDVLGNVRQDITIECKDGTMILPAFICKVWPERRKL